MNVIVVYVCMYVVMCYVIVSPSDLILYEVHPVHVNLKHLQDIYIV
jgi:hypothetical protein